eukprot:TRINITY_DN5337_c0_g3_i1.p1 TRINITY_DN5337_c0_g3~~TRINITY_DN5337_c0_g3_i1.p1  ORF type:complete len:968 (-),score=286.94 TRINITY_DN5337_c0_g3_i1:109-3012(-)
MDEEYPFDEMDDIANAMEFMEDQEAMEAFADMEDMFDDGDEPIKTVVEPKASHQGVEESKDEAVDIDLSQFTMEETEIDQLEGMDIDIDSNDMETFEEPKEYDDNDDDEPELGDKTLIMKIPPAGVETMMCKVNGELFYIPMRDQAEEDISLALDNKNQRYLGESMRDILDKRRAYSDRRRMIEIAKEAAKNNSDNNNEQLEPEARLGLTRQSSFAAEKDMATASKFSADKLWVDKYSPNTFMDLLSDSRLNRDVLRWIKAWDKVVFNKPLKIKQASATSMKRSKPMQSIFDQEHGKDKKSNFISDADKYADRKCFRCGGFGHAPWKCDYVAMGADNKPAKKIILLAGPAGVGKTTLAHVLAKRAGYKVAEVNASSERTSRTLKQRLMDAMTAQSVFGDKKPTLVILDEIDGISNTEGDALVKALMDLAQPSIKKSKNKKKKKRKRVLKISKGGGGLSSSITEKSDVPRSRITRPIICTCNNPNVPALRRMREIALIFRIKPPQQQPLISRLQGICLSENLKARTSALQALATVANQDVRSCLNTLQFLKYQMESGTLHPENNNPNNNNSNNPDDASTNSNIITQAIINNAAVGTKDLTSSNFECWKKIFSKPKSKNGQGVDSKLSSSINDLLTDHHIATHADQIAIGCHHNMVKFCPTDPGFARLVASTEWLSFSDLCSARVAINQEFHLTSYIIATIAAIHDLCHTERIIKPEAASDYYSLRNRLSTNKQLLQTFEAGTNFASNVPTKIFAVDMLSYVVNLLTPTIHGNNPMLLSDDDRQTMKMLVDQLAFYGLDLDRTGDVDRFHKKKFEEAPAVFVPPIDKLCTFNGVTSVQWHPAPSIKDMLTRNLHAEVLRRKLAATRISSDNSNEPSSNLQNKPDPNKPRTNDFNPMAPVSQLPQIRALKKKRNKVVLRGLNAFVTVTSSTKKKPVEKRVKVEDQFDVLYYHVEGYTNAVRHPIKMVDLL